MTKPATRAGRIIGWLILTLVLVTFSASAQTKRGDPPAPPPGGPSGNTILAGPVPANRTIIKNGICWAWASPCDGGCSQAFPTAQPGWRYATSAEFAARPACTDFLDAAAPGGFRCASPYFDPRFTHCDYGDCLGGFVTSLPTGDNFESWFVSDLTQGGQCGASVASCGVHRVHGHISTVPSGHFDNIADHVHHGQHGHTVTMCSPPHHGPFHDTAETEEQGLMSSSGTADRLDFVAAVNADGSTGPAKRGTVVQLFGSALGLFIGDQHDQPAEAFRPPVSGSPLYQTTTLPEVRIAGVVTKVLFSGLAPGLAGVWQINVLVPEEGGGGKLPVTINYEGDQLKSIDILVEE